MSQLAAVNTKADVGMFSFYHLLYLCKLNKLVNMLFVMYTFICLLLIIVEYFLRLTAFSQFISHD